MRVLICAAVLMLVACQSDPIVILIPGTVPPPVPSSDAGQSGEIASKDASDDGASADAGSDRTTDGNGSTSPSDCGLVRFESFEVMISAPDGTCGMITAKPSWALRSLAAATFTRPSGKEYVLVIYGRNENESVENWMARSEVGDSAAWDEEFETANRLPSFAYVSNDYGAQASVHVLIPSERFVYYVMAEETTEEVPDDLREFVRELRIE